MVIPAVIGFYGSSESGKTTLIVKTIKRLLDNGYSVATIKKTDKILSIDKKGKDTWRHSHAGASITALISKNKTDIMIYKKIKIEDIIQNISICGSFDVILIEGANDSTIPKIKLGDCKTREKTILEYQNDFEMVIRVIEKEIEKKKNQNITINVNGNQINLSKFPADIIKNTVIGMLSSLKGIDRINELKIYIKN
jgi:molybdopterin-guanine dinucleotide biosynthesis protein B